MSGGGAEVVTNFNLMEGEQDQYTQLERAKLQSLVVKCCDVKYGEYGLRSLQVLYIYYIVCFTLGQACHI